MEIHQDSYRYVNWFLFVLAALANSIPTQAFSGISPTITKIYDVTQFEANVPSLIYPISYIIVLLPANYILDKKGLKLGTLICQMCMIIGLMIRLLINVHFYLFFIGTFICSLGFCFMLSGANQFANVWFPKHQIFMVNSICVFSLFASDAVGTFLSSYFIREDATKQIIFTFFLWQSIIMITIHFMMAFFFKGQPKSIQNYASAAQRKSFKEDVLSLFKNKNYIILFASITFIFGDLSVIFVFMPWITKTYDYETVSNGLIIVCANLSGCAGCIIIGLINKRFGYKRKCAVLLLGTIVAIIFLWISLEAHSQMFSYIAGGFAGFFAYPFLTTVTDFATQTTFPVGQATAAGILLFGGQFIGVILVTIFSFIFDGQSLVETRILNSIILIISILGLLVFMLSKQILKRDEYQKSREESNSLLSKIHSVQQ